jgi:hypothetical protein
MPTTRTLAATYLAAALILMSAVPRCIAEDTVGGAEVISLEDQLKTGLKARRPEETEFIAEVAQLVDTGKLPRKLVDSAFMWAVRRGKKYPFPAFEQAIRRQADALGVNL